MKHLIFLLVIFTLISCEKIENELFTFSTEARLDIPAGLGGLITHGFVIRDIPNPLQSKYTTLGINQKDIVKISASKASLNGVFSTEDYSNIEKITISIIDKETKKPYEIYYQDIIPLNQKAPLKLFGSLLDIKEVIDASTFDINVEIQFRYTTTRKTENRIDMSFAAFGN